MEGEAASDDDFQDESLLPRRTAAHGAERQRVQQGKAKVCVTADGSAEHCDLNLNYVIYFSCFHITTMNEWHLGRYKRSSGCCLCVVGGRIQCAFINTTELLVQKLECTVCNV